MFLVHVYLDRSPLEGIGVFAKERIAKGALIWEFNELFDRVFSAELYAAQPAKVREYLDRYSYPDRRQPGHFVFEGDDAKYMNHADAPNCDFSHGTTAYALCDIEPREELTCDYNAFFGDAGFEMLGER